MDQDLIDGAYRDARADRWHLGRDGWAEALQRAVAKAGGREPRAGSQAPWVPGRQTLSRHDVEKAMRGLHLEDLALACACAEGSEEAWEHFMRAYRPVLYRAADAIDPSGRAREVADAIYAELFGVEERDGRRRSLLRYFHGMSSLGTWLRAVLSQRWVDEIRRHRRLEPLPEEDPGAPGARLSVPAAPPDPGRRRWADAMQQALAAAIAALDPRDRLRLGCYYAQEMTLAQIGRLVGEHEATVSRHLARTRRALREDVERRLRESWGFSSAEVEECFASAAEDAGTLDLVDVLGAAAPRKRAPADRSKSEGQP